MLVSGSGLEKDAWRGLMVPLLLLPLLYSIVEKVRAAGTVASEVTTESLRAALELLTRPRDSAAAEVAPARRPSGTNCFQASSFATICIRLSRMCSRSISAARNRRSSLSRSTCRCSTSTRFRSRELCAASRFRFTRSIRRCSFSSVVLALFRGGRFVLGSGSSWPHDLRFLAATVLDSGDSHDGAGEPIEELQDDVEGAGLPSVLSLNMSEEDMNGWCKSSILTVVERWSAAVDAIKLVAMNEFNAASEGREYGTAWASMLVVGDEDDYCNKSCEKIEYSR